MPGEQHGKDLELRHLTTGDASLGDPDNVARQTTDSPLPNYDLSIDLTEAHEMIHHIGDRWTMRVLSQLVIAPKRFSEIEHAVDGISHRLLSMTLRSLERDGFATRNLHPTVPPRVEYAITPLGESLYAMVMVVARWCVNHSDEIRRSRSEHDLSPPDEE